VCSNYSCIDCLDFRASDCFVLRRSFTKNLEFSPGGSAIFQYAILYYQYTMKPYIFLTQVVALLLLTSCVSTKEVLIKSNPAGASVFVDGSPLGITPFKTKMSFQDGQSYNVTLRSENFEDAELKVSYKPNTKTEYFAEMEKVETVSMELVSYVPESTKGGVKLVKKKSKSLAYLEVIETSPNVRSVQRVTNNEDSTIQYGAPVLSPTEDIITYSMGNSMDSASNLWKQSIGSPSKTKITNGNRSDIYPAFSKNGQYIYFSSNRTSENPSLWRISVKGGGGLTKITSGMSEDFGVSVNPEDNLLAYTSNLPGANEPQLWSVNTSGNLPTQLREGSFPEISPDGKKILFVRSDKNTFVERNGSSFFPSQIWVMDIDGNNETQLTQNTNYNVIHPRWSPDGSKIVYASDEAKDSRGNNNYDIWMMKSDGTQNTALTTNGSRDDFPCWDRYGRKIYFRSNRGVQWNIWSFEPLAR